MGEVSQPGVFMSFGDLALSRAKSGFLSRSACCGWIFAFEPVLENCSTPLCRKLLIIRIVYITLYNRAMLPNECAGFQRPFDMR